LNSSGSDHTVRILRKRKKVSRFIYVLVLTVFIASLPSCPGGDRGSYFLYGLQWGMGWKEVTEVLKVEELESAEFAIKEKVGAAPFFIAGVPGELKLTFKKKLLGFSALKAIRYEATIKDAGIRGEAYSVLTYDLKPDFGDPAFTKGTPEKGDDGGMLRTKPAEPYSAVWKQEDGDIIVEVDPKSGKFVLRAEANTSSLKLAWLK